jgi:mannonate dehydratase
MNTVAVMKALKDSGFNGFIIDDHVPHMVNDTPWCHRGRAWSTGYLVALLEAVKQLS